MGHPGVVYSAYTTVTRHKQCLKLLSSKAIWFFIYFAELKIIWACCFYVVNETSGQKMNLTVGPNVYSALVPNFYKAAMHFMINNANP